MAQEDLLKRITARPDVFGRKPIIRGMRISVELILSLLAQGESEQAILDDYPDLEADDIRACIAYAHGEGEDVDEAFAEERVPPERILRARDSTD